RLKYASMLAVDGNFHLHRNKKGKADQPLTRNAGFWVDDGEFDDYITAKGARPDSGEKNQKCHSFKAGDPSRSSQKSGKTVTGVVMARALASVIRQQDPHQRHIHTYDIGCKYSVNFQKRVTRSVDGELADTEAASRDSLPKDVLIGPSDFPSDFEIKVPSWHVLGHTHDCILENNLRYTPLVGRTAGEGVETIWAVMNKHQYSTREMSHGHRRDVLTDLFNDYNWRKLTKEAKRVHEAYFAAYQVYLSKEAELKEIENRIEPQQLDSMRADSKSRGFEQFGAASQKGPSRASVLIELKKKEENENLSLLCDDQNTSARPPLPHSGALFLSNAMDLENLQYQLRTRDVDEYIAEGSVGADKRRAQHMKSMDALRRRIDEHLEALVIVAPGLDSVSLGRAQVPTSQPLYLPSSFGDRQRETFGLGRLAEQEARLRIGSAHDHLSGLRDALGLRGLLLQAKRAHVQGQVKTTRAEASVTRAGKVVESHKAGYRRNWDAICKLHVGTSEGQPGYGLKPLLEDDIGNLENFIKDRNYNGNPAELPWIWHSVGGSAPHGASTSEVQKSIETWEQEVFRLTWLHAQTSRDRWKEEHILLRSEAERITLSFRYAATSWRALTPPFDLDSKTQRGILAYGQKKGSMFDELAKEANVHLAIIDKH
ncbi:hypothetical protein FS837_012809, partial [Tulasnella sp. UAMH 9824]